MPAKDSSTKPSWPKPAEFAVLFAVFAVLLGVCLSFVFLPKQSAGFAEVVLKGTKLYTLPLAEDADKEIHTDHGHVHVSVRKGGVAVASSPCHSQFCVHQGYKYNVGESIVCLPEGVAVYLVSYAEIGEIDA